MGTEKSHQAEAFINNLLQGDIFLPELKGEKAKIEAAGESRLAFRYQKDNLQSNLLKNSHLTHSDLEIKKAFLIPKRHATVSLKWILVQ